MDEALYIYQYLHFYILFVYFLGMPSLHFFLSYIHTPVTIMECVIEYLFERMQVSKMNPDCISKNTNY